MKKLLIAFLTISLLNVSCFDLMNFKKHELSDHEINEINIFANVWELLWKYSSISPPSPQEK